MPYIKKQNREKLNPSINSLLNELKQSEYTPGDINYIFSKICKQLFEDNKSYARANMLIGVLECVKLELYRRQIALYEDEKIKENGDLVLEEWLNKMTAAI